MADIDGDRQSGTLIFGGVEYAGSSTQGRASLNSCGTAIIMKQSPASVDKIIEFFKLSNGTRDFLLQAKKGEALLYMEGKVSAIAIEILDKEKEMLKV